MRDNEPDLVQRWTTDVGIAELDTQDLELWSPGIQGQYMAEKIKSNLLTISDREPSGGLSLASQDFEGNKNMRETFSNTVAILSNILDVTGDRNVVIVGYDIKNRLDEITREFGVELRAR